jgi:formylglycine-generating enzyme required for sulfatase activity
MLGQQISHYRLLRSLGRGSFGEVFEAAHLHLPDLRVAVKVLHAGLAGDDDFVKALQAEYRVLSRLKHPHIVGFRDVLVGYGYPPALVLDLVDGGSLEGRLGAGPVPPAEVMALLQQALEALAYAHGEGVIHRDLKPGNLLLDGQGRVQVVDFGIAKAADTGRSTRTGMSLGTPAYMAPELFDDAGASAQSDLYALGLVAWELLTGLPACTAGTPMAAMKWHATVGPRPVADLVVGVPAALAALVGRLTAAEAGARPASAEAALAELLGQESGVSRPPAPRLPWDMEVVPVPAEPPGRALGAPRWTGTAGVVVGAGAGRAPNLAAARAPAVAAPPVAPAVAPAVAPPAGERPAPAARGAQERADAGAPVAPRTDVPAQVRPPVRAEAVRPVVAASPATPAVQAPPPATGARRRVEGRAHGSFSFEMAYIPAGRFVMGSPPEEPGRIRDEEQHDVTLTRAFELGVVPVTQALYEAVMGNNPSRYTDPTRPVERVSWYDAVALCNALSAAVGLEAAYAVSGPAVARTVQWRWGAAGYRLPTEAEWEYAARAGGRQLYAGSDDVDAVGWTGLSWVRGTHAVGQKRANAWGLHDMSGNVWEWCWDWYGAYSGSSTDPAGAQSGHIRVVRGGSWDGVPRDARVAYRYRLEPGLRVNTLGLRLVRTIP